MDRRPDTLTSWGNTFCVHTGAFMGVSLGPHWPLSSSLFWEIVTRGFLGVEFPKILPGCHQHSVAGPNSFCGAGQGKFL